MPDRALALWLELLDCGLHAVGNQDANGGILRHGWLRDKSDYGRGDAGSD